MARIARVVVPDIPHHITQRGNARRAVFQCDADRLVYLQLLGEYSGLHRLRLLGYCLMPNHVHLVAIPAKAESLPLTLRLVHGRYANYFNSRYRSSGHLWQGRYYSCPLDGTHLWAALRYTELNPVRAGMVPAAEEFPWSSAAVHCGSAGRDSFVDLAPWAAEWRPEEWWAHLALPEGEEQAEMIRRATHIGRPLGDSDFVKRLESELHRPLAPKKGGRPRKLQMDEGQEALPFRLG
jgi:putative transposase